MKTLQISRSKLWICTLLLSNLLSIGIICIIEKYSNFIKLELAERGYINIKHQYYSDYRAIQGWNNSIEKLHLNFDAVFFGNSITKGGDFKLFFPDINILNLGYPGDNIIGMRNRVFMLKTIQPDKIFIMAGINDLFTIDIDEYKNRYQALIDDIQKNCPDANIYIQSLLPCNHYIIEAIPNETIIKANNIAYKLAVQNNCTFINLYNLYCDENGELRKELTTDGLHLTPTAYNIWAEQIRAYIYE